MGRIGDETGGVHVIGVYPAGCNVGSILENAGHGRHYRLADVGRGIAYRQVMRP